MELKIFKGFERFEDHYPAEAVKYAMENRTEAIPELLEILEYTLSDAEKEKALLEEMTHVLVEAKRSIKSAASASKKLSFSQGKEKIIRSGIIYYR